MRPLLRFFPFLRWFPIRAEVFKADLMAGVTVALVLIPQSMAYAQLAGMPAYYGLYAAFLPVALAALWGSSNQLGTGPVAVVSLLTASSLAPFAATGSEQFVALAIMLALLVGIVQLALGLLKLGVIVSFLSHPVIVGFTNAAAIIIALSQVSKLFGVPMGRSESFLLDIWGVFRLIGETHLPTFSIGLLAIAIMWSVRRFRPKWPGVLIAVAITTLISWAAGFESSSKARLEDIREPEARALAAEFTRIEDRIYTLNAQLIAKGEALKNLEKQKHEGKGGQEALALHYEQDLLRLEIEDREAELRKAARDLRQFTFDLVPSANGTPVQLHAQGKAPAGATVDGHRWRIKRIYRGEIDLSGGGDVVGRIPEGLPRLALPKFDLDRFGALLSAAIIISLVGFLEAISIAKAMAAKTKQRLNPNQELIGQGLANIVGSMSQAFPVSGSFSRSAVNLGAGAVTGMSSVITSLLVLLTLLFLTPLLYHLPQSVLAAIIIMAVIGLVNVKAVAHAWRASRHDGVAAVTAFVATLAFAPHLDKGIMVGAGVALGLYLYRTMKPRVAILGRHGDGTLRDIRVNPNLPTSKHMLAIRFDGSLYFANVSYFEDAVLEAVAHRPEAKYLLVVGDGINQLDASGEEVVRHLVDRLKENGITLVFSGLKRQVLDVMHNTGLFDAITQVNIFPTEEHAIAAIYQRLGIEAENDSFYSPRPMPA